MNLKRYVAPDVMTFAPVTDTSSDWQALQKGLHRFVRARVPLDAVEDVVSEILEAIIRSKSSLANASNPSAWIYACARSKVVDYYRKRGRENRALDALKAEHEIHLATVSLQDRDEDTSGLHECLGALIVELDRDDQHILDEIDLKQTRQTEFARRRNLPLPTVKSRIQRARRRLRDRLVACCPDGCDDNCQRGTKDTAAC
ncbi:MAG: sigma-70 family RNA polymerase sigma factor [Porticoccaceae bacterium]|uniref:sigma-70 family RNA polymerase sigma factor n=1 Tax=Thalassospira sp. TaxID=1912094 RepID=UPI003A87B518